MPAGHNNNRSGFRSDSSLTLPSSYLPPETIDTNILWMFSWDVPSFCSFLASELAETRDHAQGKIHDLRNQVRDRLILASGAIKNEPTKTLVELTGICKLLIDLSVEQDTVCYVSRQLAVLESVRSEQVAPKGGDHR